MRSRGSKVKYCSRKHSGRPVICIKAVCIQSLCPSPQHFTASKYLLKNYVGGGQVREYGRVGEGQSMALSEYTEWLSWKCRVFLNLFLFSLFGGWLETCFQCLMFTFLVCRSDEIILVLRFLLFPLHWASLSVLSTDQDILGPWVLLRREEWSTLFINTPHFMVFGIEGFSAVRVWTVLFLCWKWRVSLSLYTCFIVLLGFKDW